MGVPDDANPLNRRLPAEVVSRRRKVEKVEKEETPLATDRGQVLALKPEHRLKWLSKALQKCQEGRVPINTVFDIVTHAKFTSDASDKIGSKMFRAIRANLQLFSQKQQRFLEGECRLVQLFKGTVRGGGGGGDAPDPSATAPAAAASSGDADGATESEAKPNTEGIASLWARMTQLSPMERVEAVEKLDASTKELLEDFLEARIKRAQATQASTASTETQSSGAEAAGPEASAAPAAAAAAAASSTATAAAPEKAPPQGSRSRSDSDDSDESHDRDTSRGRNGRRRSRSRAAEKSRKARERSRSEARAKRGREAKSGRRQHRDRDEGRRGRKAKGRRGRSSSGSGS